MIRPCHLGLTGLLLAFHAAAAPVRVSFLDDPAVRLNLTLALQLYELRKGS